MMKGPVRSEFQARLRGCTLVSATVYTSTSRSVPADRADWRQTGDEWVQTVGSRLLDSCVYKAPTANMTVVLCVLSWLLVDFYPLYSHFPPSHSLIYFCNFVVSFYLLPFSFCIFVYVWNCFVSICSSFVSLSLCLSAVIFKPRDCSLSHFSCFVSLRSRLMGFFFVSLLGHSVSESFHGNIQLFVASFFLCGHCVAVLYLFVVIWHHFY